MAWVPGDLKVEPGPDPRAGRMAWSPDEIEVEQSTVQLGWRDAWRTETRDTHGRWTHGPHLPSAGPETRGEYPGYKGQFFGQDTLVPDMTPAVNHKPLDQPGRPGGAGTADDPIDVQGDMGKAADLMIAGKHVRLNSKDEIRGLYTEINRRADAYVKANGSNPKWDIANISVEGTRMFDEQNRGIPRVQMPQLSGSAQPGTEAALLAGGANKFVDIGTEFRKQLKADGVDVKNERVRLKDIRGTQSQLTAATVMGITHAAQAGSAKVQNMLKEPLWVTSDNYVIDGHHRWAAQGVDAVLNGTFDTQEIPIERVQLPASLAIPYANWYATRMGLEGVVIGNNKLVSTANLLTDQAGIELAGWHDAWKHETRGPHGEWVHGQGYPGQLVSEISARDDKAALDGARRVINDAAPAVPGMLGGGRESWNGKVALLSDESASRDVLGELDWDGEMRLRRDVAQSMASTMSQDPRTPVRPSPFEVTLHELVHGVIPEHDKDRQSNGDMYAYQDYAQAQIEEGFTELGSIQHMRQFADTAGIGNRLTEHPGPNGYATVGEYADQLNNPSMIHAGIGWGHYPGQTKSALDWTNEVARADGRPGDYAYMQQLADEINQQGTAGKVLVMVDQVLRTELKNNQIVSDERSMARIADDTRNAILGSFRAGEPAAQASASARAAARQMAHSIAMEKLQAERAA